MSAGGFDNCPICKSLNLCTFRHPFAKFDVSQSEVWCNDCGYVLRQEGEGRPPQPQTDKERIKQLEAEVDAEKAMAKHHYDSWLDICTKWGEKDVEVRRLEAEVEHYKQIIQTDCEYEKEIRILALKVLTDKQINGDSYGVPTLPDIMELVVAEVERLKKYEIKIGEFDVDIYLNHYSDLGIDIAEVKKSARSQEGFLVPSLEILFLLKLFAWENRCGSAKGQKDELDIFSLITQPEFNWEKYQKLVIDFRLKKYYQLFVALLKKTNNIKELAINEQKMAKIKKEILGKIEK